MVCDKKIVENPAKESCSIIGQKVFPLDWTDLVPGIPYFDSDEQKYCISVETNWTSPGTDDILQQRKDTAKPIAIRNLIKAFEKDLNTEIDTRALSPDSLSIVRGISDEAINNFLLPEEFNSFDDDQRRNFILMVLASETVDHHITIRPNPDICPFGMKVLVCIKKDIFDLLKLDEDAPLPIAANEIILVSSELKEKIRKVQKLFDKYSEDSATSPAGRQIDFEKQSINIGRFGKILEGFLNSNGYTIRSDRSDLIIIGIDDSSRVLYVLFDDNNDFIRLRCNFVDFVTNEFVLDPLTISFMLRLSELTRETNKALPFMTFLENFPSLDLQLPNISFSLPGGCIAKFGLEVKKMDKKPSKSSDQKNKEDEYFQVKENLLTIEGCNNEISLESIKQKFEKEFAFLNDINDLEGLFNLFLNRNNFACFAAAAMECVMNNLPLDEIKKALLEAYAKNVLEFEDFLHLIDVLGININTIESLAGPFYNKFVICYSQIPEDELEVLKEQSLSRVGIDFSGVDLKINPFPGDLLTLVKYPSQISEKVEEVKNLNSDIKKLSSGFGFRGKLLLKESYEENKGAIFDELVNQVGVDRIATANISSMGGATAALTLGDAAMDAVSSIDICDFPFLFNLPRFELLDFEIPTFDIMGAAFEAMLLAILDALTTALIQIVKGIINEILKFCSGKSNLSIPNLLDGVNPDQLLKNALAQSGLPIPDHLPTDSREWFDATKDLLRGLGVPFPDIPSEADLLSGNILPGFANLNPSGKNIITIGRNISDLLDDLSVSLTPSEIANLLNGTPDADTKKIINCLLDSKYEQLGQQLRPAGSPRNNINSVFKNLGRMISNKQVILNQIIFANDFTGFKNICDTTDEPLRRRLLSGRGLTPQEIDNELNKERVKKIARLGELARVVQDPKAFDELIPPLFCKKNSDGSTSPGIVPLTHPSFVHALDQTTDVIYDGARMSFDQEISNFKNVIDERSKNISKVRKIPKIKKFTSEAGDEVDLINPEYSRAVAQGSPPLKSNGEPDPEPLNPEKEKNGYVLSTEEEQSRLTGRKSFVAAGLKEAFENLETDLELGEEDTEEEPSRKYFKLVFSVPNALKDVKSDQSTLPPGLSDLFGPAANNFSNLFSQGNSSNNIVEYIVPPQSEQFSDSYSLKIIKGNADPVIISSSVQHALPPNISNFIDRNGLVYSGDTAPQISYFGSLIVKSLREGAPIIKNGEIVREQDKPRGSFGIGSPRLADDYSLYQANDPLRAAAIRGKEYFNVLSDILSYIGKEVSKSSLFESRVMSLVDFLQIPLDEDGNPIFVKDPSCDPHLLNLNKIKKEMKDKLLNALCDGPVLPPLDGLGSTSTNPMERAGINGAVQTFIRVYCIELVLSSIFVFSRFNISEENVDQVILDYFSEQIRTDINRLFENDRVRTSTASRGKKFKEIFEEQVIITHNNLINDGTIANREKSRDYLFSLEGLINLQLPDVIKRITNIIQPRQASSRSQNQEETAAQSDLAATLGAAFGQGSISEIERIIFEKNLPLLDVIEKPASESLRNLVGASSNRVILPNASTRFKLSSDLNSSNFESTTLSGNSVTFSLANGNFILEKYIKIVDKTEEEIQNEAVDFRLGQSGVSITPDIIDIIKNRPNNLKGIVNLKEWQAFLNENRLSNINLSSVFKGWSYGLRLVYIPSDEFPIDAFNGTLQNDVINFDKSFKTMEAMQRRSSNNSVVTEVKTFISIPLVYSEKEINLTRINSSEIETRWNLEMSDLKNNLMQSSVYKFIFQYCLPLDRLMFLNVILSSVYLSSLDEFKTLFDGTKQSLRIVLETLLNGGDYKYKDTFIEDLGGNAGMMAQANNTANTEPSIPGISLLPIAIRTPLMILKGLVELVDPNISIARKIVDLAKTQDKDIPIQLASLGLLPMNVFPPPPIGPGIGPPITPLGFIYLALDIDGAMNDAKSINNRREQTQEAAGINFNASANEALECDNTEEED